MKHYFALGLFGFLSIGHFVRWLKRKHEERKIRF